MVKYRLLTVTMILVFAVAGCGGEKARTRNGTQEEVSAVDVSQISAGQGSGHEQAGRIAALYRDIQDEAAQAGTLGELQVTERIVERIGEGGYVVVDEENQTDMRNPEQVLAFCGAVDAGEVAELTIIVVTDFGSFVKYDFHTQEGEVEVVRGYYRYGGGRLENLSVERYRADSWQYTQEGYLMFGGSSFSEDYYVLSLSETSERVALRVEPLDQKCRELNRQYLQPLGYEQNNLFLVDWNGEDYGELDFYDLFDRFYPAVRGESVPFTADENMNVETVYRIPAEQFETVINRYFSIERDALRQRTVWLREDGAYEYRPRGFHDSEYPDIPCPEVVDYTQNSDGTLTLVVNAVYPQEGTSRAFAHRTVIRPLEDGGFQYVSNQMLYPEGGYDPWWRCERLTEQEWKEICVSDGKEKAQPGEGSPSPGPVREPGELFSEAEKEELQETALRAAAQAEEVYRDVDTQEDLLYTRVVSEFSPEQRKKVVSLLGAAGYVSVSEGINMENPDRIRAFYDAYLEKQEAMVTVFDVGKNGLTGACTFLCRDGRIQTFYALIGWQEGGIPEIISTEVGEIAQIRLTQKGYFIYAWEQTPHHASLRQYWRVAPLSDRCRELTEKYVSGLSYTSYNILVTDWNRDNAQDILIPCMFEDLCHMDTGQAPRPENGEIPAALYERIMTTYLPVTVQQVREICGYREETDSYPYQMIFSAPYPPFGEVVDYRENPDKTLTLFVDGVWPDYDSDCAFANVITVEPFADGTFRYLSNSIEKRELEIPAGRGRE